MWQGFGFTGLGVAFQGNADHYHHLLPEELRGIDDQGRSMFNDGKPGDKSAVRFFEHVGWDLGGKWGCISAGVKVSDLSQKGFDELISSHPWVDSC